MYSDKSLIIRIIWPLISIFMLYAWIANTAEATTLEERAIYTMKILVWDDPAGVDQCSAFAFGDVSTLCATGAPSAMVDNEVLGPPPLAGGNGIAGDGLAGTITIETSKADMSGILTLTLSSFQVDPYLATAGGTFKTTMTTNGFAGAGGSVDALGNMDLDITGRTGIAEFFVANIGEQPWNINDSASVAANGDPITNLYEPFTTGSSSNYDPAAGGINLTLAGRPIGDANTDGILDAVLVSVSNVGTPWLFFDGTPYSEAFNVQFELISAKPVANPDSLNTNQDTPLIIDEATDLLANDTHATGDPISVIAFTQPAQAGASVVDNDNGTLTYTPAAGFFGTDSFDYTISDAGGAQDSTTVTISVSAAGNTPPTANDINVVTDEGTPLDVDPTSNDTDPDGDPLTITAFDNPSVQGGTVIDNGNNLLTYSPAPGFNGADSFGYTNSDGKGGTDSATVFVTVNPVNDPLVCTDVAFNTDISTNLNIDIANDLLSTCTDPENDTITLDSFTQPTQAGSMVTRNGGTLIYTPKEGFSGQDSFTYTATDGTNKDTKTVLVDVGKIFGNFTMLDAGGATFGGTNDLVNTWDGSLNTAVTDTNFNMTMASDEPFPFFGFVWIAHHIRVFGPGTYMFDTSCSVAQVEQGLADCGGTAEEFITLTVGPGQIGGHILFDWNVTKNIDVVNLWEPNAMYTNPDPRGSLYLGPAGPPPNVDCLYEYASIDGDGDTVPGVRFVDGPFIGFRANYNLNFERNCGAGDTEIQVSTIKSSDPGGCTLSGTTTAPLNRSDLWLMLGFIALLGAFVTRRRILGSGLHH